MRADRMTEEQLADLLMVCESARSCWGFMSNDMSLSKDERAAARRLHDTSEALIAGVRETVK